ncbi:hypothetical protein KAW38_04670 [Candidatus Micrarchaeota archaeon]|nr:hypothetical protein [Candidatus Micrarchaeota archaeon]
MAGEENDKAEQQARMEQQLKMYLRISLEPDAYERLMNVRLSDPRFYTTAAQQVLGLYKKFNRKIKEEELLMLLRSLRGKKKESKITFK